MIWIHYSLEQRHHILYKESYKKHFKIPLKDTPKWPQMAPFGGLGATSEPARYQGRKLHPNLTPQAPKMRPIWIPKETPETQQNPQKSLKNAQKILTRKTTWKSQESEPSQTVKTSVLPVSYTHLRAHETQ